MRAILSCGGTGGHIYPAIAIADKIKELYPDAEILFIGTKGGMENTLVPAAGYRIEGIDASGFDRKNPFNNFKTLSNLATGSHQAKKIISDFGPDIAIGTGGYVTGTVILQAHRLGIRTCIHEQNAVPGVANKLLSKFADRVFVSFAGTEGCFAHPYRVVFTGNPIRSDFTRLSRDGERKALGLEPGDSLILAFGGSLGAEVLNREVMGLIKAVSEGKLEARPRVCFVTGKRYYTQISGELESIGMPDFLTLTAYANNMPQLMTASDLVISRAGAIAVSEITACGKPSVLIPSPNVTNNHQYHNAKAIADTGAALLLEEKNLQPEKAALAEEVLRLISDKSALEEMGRKALDIGRTNAADIICENLGIL